MIVLKAELKGPRGVERLLDVGRSHVEMLLNKLSSRGPLMSFRGPLMSFRGARTSHSVGFRDHR